MSKLSNPNLRFVVPQATVLQSLDFFRRQGAMGHEGVALWAGRTTDDTCRIDPTPIIPRQITGPRSYRIPQDEVFRVIEGVAAAGLVIPIQIHSHPTEAFHSDADDEYAFLQHRNAISMVVPEFGTFPDSSFLSKVKYYYLREGSIWEELASGTARKKFVFEGF